MVNTNISKSEKIVANTRVEKIVSKFEPPCYLYIYHRYVQNSFQFKQNSCAENYAGRKETFAESVYYTITPHPRNGEGKLYLNLIEWGQ